MATNISNSPEETAALGESAGASVLQGTVFVLAGGLGAGKTQWVKGFARGLGITQTIHSPTFSLVNIYEGGRLTLFHLDLYRLETREEIVRAGLLEYLEPPGITIVEWGDKWFEHTIPGSDEHIAARPEWITFESISENSRRIIHERPGT